MSEALKQASKILNLSNLVTNKNLKTNPKYLKFIAENTDLILKATGATANNINQKEIKKALGKIVNNPAAVEELVNQEKSGKSGGGKKKSSGKNNDNLSTSGTSYNIANGDVTLGATNNKPLTREEEYYVKNFSEQFPNNLPAHQVLKQIEAYGLAPMLHLSFINYRREANGLFPNPAPASNLEPNFEKMSVQKFKEKFPTLAIGLSDKQIAYGLSLAPKGLLYTALQNEYKDLKNVLKPTNTPTTPQQQPILNIANSIDLNRTTSIALHYAKLTNIGINPKDKDLYAQSLVEASKIKALLSATKGGTLTLNDYLSVSKNPTVGRQVFLNLSSGDNKITGYLEKDNDIVAQIKAGVKDKDIVQYNAPSSIVKQTSKVSLAPGR